MSGAVMPEPFGPPVAAHRQVVPRQIGKGFKSGTAHGNNHRNEPASYSEVLKNKSCNLATV